MNDELKKNLGAKEKWIRFLFMILFAIVNYFVQMVIGVVALVQFIIILITGKANDNLLHFGSGVSAYVYHIMSFLTYGREEKPYPFSEWPVRKIEDSKLKTEKTKKIEKTEKKKKD